MQRVNTYKFFPVKIKMRSEKRTIRWTTARRRRRSKSRRVLKAKDASTYDVENVECCQRIFGARKAAAHLRLRPFFAVLVESLQPRSTRVAGSIHNARDSRKSRRALHEGITCCAITINKFAL